MKSSCFIAILGSVLTTSFLLAGEILPLLGNEKAPVYQITLSEKDDIPKLLRDIKSRWPGPLIDPRSEDYAVLRFVSKNKEIAKKAIPELLELASLMEPPPIISTNLPTKLGLSPAGSALARIDEEAEPFIKAWLDAGPVSEEAREVLKLVLSSINSSREYRLWSEAKKKLRESRQSKNPGAAPQ